MFINTEQRLALTKIHSELQELNPKHYMDFEFKTNGFFSIVKNEKGRIIHNINVMDFEDDALELVNAYQQKLAMHLANQEAA